ETLSLQQIENRILAWREQSQFQSRLLAGFLSRTGQLDAGAPGNTEMLDNLARLDGFLDSREALLYPAWQTQRLVQADGQLGEAELLRLGPVRWYRQGVQAGLASSDGDLVRVALG